MKFFLNVFLIITFFVNVVFPNSFQVLSIGLLILCNILIASIGGGRIGLRLMMFWLFLSLIFILFIAVSNLPSKDFFELSVKYIISPFLWLHLCNYILKNISREKILSFTFNFFLLSNLSVIILYIITSMGFTNISSLFITKVNIDQNTGLGFTLHVYGSMIFFITALFPLLLAAKKSVYLKMLLFFSLLTAVILSGRTALFLSLFIAFATLVIKYRKNYLINSKNVFFIICTLSVIYLIFINFYQKFFDVNLIDYIEQTHLAKIEQGGGGERSAQYEQIVDAIYNNPLGNGFISLNIIRDLERPYNFEMLTLSTLMRFGFIVTFFILFSLRDLIAYLFKFIRSQNFFADIMLLGFLGIILASFTNPYLESFSFQWMFFFPLIYFFNYYEGNISK